jgi:hypothetical protein
MSYWYCVGSWGRSKYIYHGEKCDSCAYNWRGRACMFITSNVGSHSLSKPDFNLFHFTRRAMQSLAILAAGSHYNRIP